MAESEVNEQAGNNAEHGDGYQAAIIKNTLDNIVNNIREFIMIVDEDYIVQYVPESIKRLTGRSPNRIIGRRCYSSIMGTNSPCKNCQLEALKEHKVTKMIDHEILTHRGFNVILRSTFASFLSESTPYYIEVMEDVTSNVRLVDNLNRKTKQLKASNVIAKLEKQKVESEYELTKNMLDSIQEGIMLVNLDYSIRLMNTTKHTMYGIGDTAISSGLKCYQVYGFDAPCPGCLIDSATRDEYREVRKQGNSSYSVSFSRFSNHIVEVSRNITQELKLIQAIRENEAKINKASKMLQAAHDKIDAEARRIGEIQASIVPVGLPNNENIEFGSFYLPMEQAGGDYFDVIDYGNGHYALIVADVSGHGVYAAVIMTVVRVIVHFNKNNPEVFLNPSKMLSIINEELISNSYTRGEFVTMFYMVINTNDKSGEYASAGHNPIVHYIASTGDVAEYTARGLMLGVLPGVKYEMKNFFFSINDIFFLYTDGLTEAMNDSREQFGLPSLISSIKTSNGLDTQTLVSNAVEAMKAFTKRDGFEDDITILAARIKS